MWYHIKYINLKLGESQMKHVKTINKADLKKSALTGGCGECQASCQTASKVDNTVSNQKCER